MLPYLVVADIWRAKIPADQRARVPWLPAAWWACWLLSWFTAYRLVNSVEIASDGTRTASDSVEFFLATTWPSKLFTTAAAILLILVIQRISARQVAQTQE